MPLGSIISAGASLIGGALSNRSRESVADQSAALSREFAQHGIRWKVRDAQKAGIHPLAALGVPPISPTIAGSYGTNNGIADAGQAIGNAIDRIKTDDEKAVDELVKQNWEKRNQLLDAEVAALNSETMRANQASQSVPGMPNPHKGLEEITQDAVKFRGPDHLFSWDSSKGAPTSDVEDHYGDVAGSVYGVGKFAYDVARELMRHRDARDASSWRWLKSKRKKSKGAFKRYNKMPAGAAIYNEIYGN
jgi:hypothetical protein